MLFKNITILDENLEIRENCYVGIKDSLIDYIGSEEPQADYGEVYDGKGRLLMPGFVNGHAHTPMTLLRGYGENLKLDQWLNERIFPFEAKLTGEDVYYSTLLGIAESLRYGIVSTTDMYYFCNDMANAFKESGAKANIGRALTCFEVKAIEELESFQEAKALYKDWHGAADGRILVDMSLHAEYTSNARLVKELADYTKDLGARMHVHCSETLNEVEGCKARHKGRTPVEYFAEQGLLNQPATLAHCVWLEGDDFNILKEKGATVATCPVSNLKLSSGICNVPKLLEKGVNVMIGTDSVSSNNSLNFIEEMKFFALLNKERREDPTLITPKETLYAATAAGAAAQGRSDCGKLAVGYKADLIVLDITGPNMYPVHDLLNNIVYSASGSDVVMTMADGKVLYKDGEYLTIDIEKVKYEVERSKVRILNELNA
ncbi:MAG: amidohydrolase [Clostridiales bacterium]|nr:amidohydrolase [Clostridiales bacterium]